MDPSSQRIAFDGLVTNEGLSVSRFAGKVKGGAARTVAKYASVRSAAGYSYTSGKVQAMLGILGKRESL